MRQETDGVRVRWTGRSERSHRSEERAAVIYTAARKRPLSAASRASKTDRERAIGSYEVSYDIRHGYGCDRTIIRP
jgi:hypothetical protein